MEAMEFLIPDTYIIKEDLTLETNAKLVHNPLSKDLDNLNEVDVDYDFSVYGEIKEQTQET